MAHGGGCRIAYLPNTPLYAHSTGREDQADWEPLNEHLEKVGGHAGANASGFDAAPWGNYAGRLHDLGKAKPGFQAYLRGERGSEPHSGEGARYALEHLGGLPGKLIAYCIAGHHAGLANGGHAISEARPPTPLKSRLEKASAMELPPWLEVAPPNTLPSPLKGFGEADPFCYFRLHFFTRMLFSALVDADFLETEAFYDRIERRTRYRGWHGALEDLRDALNARLAAFGPPEGTVNTLRAEILDHARAQASAAPGLFSLTVPTGGGKTLSSLAFALDHALHHGLERVIYVIPYTSIVEQTAQVFREALRDDDAVLEHHASFNWEGVEDRKEEERLRLAAQNWDRPVVVTTAVQFFESLFANRPSKCRKLHRLARSVIVLDEAQTLPLRLLRPCLAALQELSRGYGASVVLCTATQPALIREDGFGAPEALLREDVRELAPDPPRLYEALRRVRVRDAGALDDAALAGQVCEQDQCLVILNNIRHAQALYRRLRDLPGACHLSTRMTAAHRRAILEMVKGKLSAGQPVRLVSTSVVEAGVDVDFPQVWREAAGIDSIAQAAGRCNREGRRQNADVFVFRTTEDFPPPADLKQFATVGAEVLARHDDPLSLDAVRDYFRQLYWDRGPAALDAAEFGTVQGIMRTLQNAGNQMEFPFADIAAAFRMIPDGGVPLVIMGGAWGAPEELLQGFATQQSPHAGTIARALQVYQVQIPEKRRKGLMDVGAAEIWCPDRFGEQFVLLRNKTLYDENTGLSFEEAWDLGGLIS